LGVLWKNPRKLNGWNGSEKNLRVGFPLNSSEKVWEPKHPVEWENSLELERNGESQISPNSCQDPNFLKLKP